jgi:hypothetical protein
MALKFLYLTQIDITVKENRKWIIILGDFSIIISGLREFFLIGGSVIALGVSYVVYKFSFTREMPWMDLFHFLEGKHGLTPRQMGIRDLELVKELIVRYKSLVYLVEMSFPPGILLFGVLLSYMIIKVADNTQEIVLLLLWAYIHFIPTVYLMLQSVAIVAIVFYTVIYYITIRGELFNHKLDRIIKGSHSGPLALREFIEKLEIRSIIRGHAAICSYIWQANAFFGEFYTLGIIISLPINLIGMNLIIFTPMNHLTLLLYSFFILLAWTGIFLFGFVLAKVHYKVNKTYKKMCKLQWKFNNTPTVYKIKVRLKRKNINSCLNLF